MDIGVISLPEVESQTALMIIVQSLDTRFHKTPHLLKFALATYGGGGGGILRINFSVKNNYV